MLLATAGCSSAASGAPVRTIAYLFNGSTDDADEVTGPALAGLRLAALASDRVEVDPVDIGDPDEVVPTLRALGDDRGVVAAVVAPWTPAPDPALRALADAGVPVITFSWAWQAPAAHRAPWLTMSLPAAGEAALLVQAGEANAPPGSSLCLASDALTMSRTLADLVGATGARGPRIEPVGVVDPSRPATASAVAGRIAERGCAGLLWSGGVEAATLLVAASDDPIPIVATSRMKTDDGTTLAAENGAPVITTCGCLDVDLSLDDADQRFVHDLQAESGSAPGIFGVEAYDAGRLLVRLIDRAGGDRASLAAGLARTDSWDGLGGTYRLEPDGSWSQGTIPAAWWRAVGSRWLPEPVSKP